MPDKTIELAQEDKRTTQQNRALHLYFRWVAKQLNEAGYDVKTFFKKDFDIPFTAEIVKDHIWKATQNIYLNKKSTTELNKIKDIDEIYDILNKHLSEKFGIHVPFPCLEDFLKNEYGVS